MPDDRTIAVDWGTSSFRAYLLGTAGEILDRRASPAGILHVGEGGFPATLKAETGAWLAAYPSAAVVMSGMIGSRQGWMEVPYQSCPCDLDALASGLKRLDWPEAEVWIVPGLIDRTTPGLPDVMRGEETQVFGALSELSGDSALICLPGTHSKWVTFSAGAITGFATYMTGEVYDLLQGHSILGRLMTPDAVTPDQWFAEGVACGAGNGDLLRLLFSARSRVLDGQMPESGARAYLSGLLIGREISAARAASEEAAEEVVLLGAPSLAKLYEAAAGQLGCAARLMSDEVVAQGLFQLADCRGGAAAAR